MKTGTKIRNYEKNFGIAYHGSTQKVMITVPDSIKFPSTRAWIWVQDARTIVISPDQPKHAKGAIHAALGRNKILKGCRTIYSDAITHGIGSPFRVQDTRFERKGDRFHIEIPAEEDRMAPKTRGKADPAPQFKLQDEPEPATPVCEEEEHETVTIVGYGSEWKYRLTAEELLELTAAASRMSHD